MQPAGSASPKCGLLDGIAFQRDKTFLPKVPRSARLLRVPEIHCTRSECLLFRLYFLRCLARSVHLLNARSSLRSSSALLAVSESAPVPSATLLQSPANLVKVARHSSSFVAIQIPPRAKLLADGDGAPVCTVLVKGSWFCGGVLMCEGCHTRDGSYRSSRIHAVSGA